MILDKGSRNWCLINAREAQISDGFRFIFER